jgi:glycosyltransferase involved in cell wall biosynthesis
MWNIFHEVSFLMQDKKFVILMPVFNDWTACQKILIHLDNIISSISSTFEIIIVDDGSTSTIHEDFTNQMFKNIYRIHILRLKRNLGHQRAISIGLAYIEANVACEAVVVMDSDGEDNPADVPKLLEKYEQELREKIVFAERSRRSERWTFRIFYALYKSFHRLLTGHSVRVGNFSVIPHVRLRSLVVVSELWNHYAAAVFSSRQPYCSIPTVRATRVDGTSKMNFVGLVIHGLSAISVFSETVGVRLLITVMSWMLLAICGIVSVAVIRLFSGLAIPGWATFTTGILFIILIQSIVLVIVFSFIILNNRKESGFLPIKEYTYFISKLDTIWEKQ